jgi:hypothetical protein
MEQKAQVLSGGGLSENRKREIGQNQYIQPFQGIEMAMLTQESGS